jgi:hypothetical protein
MNRTGKTGNTLDLSSGAFMEAIWETFIALAITAAISISLISLSAHLNQAKVLRDAASATVRVGAVSVSPSIDSGAAEAATNIN